MLSEIYIFLAVVVTLVSSYFTQSLLAARFSLPLQMDQKMRNSLLGTVFGLGTIFSIFIIPTESFVSKSWYYLTIFLLATNFVAITLLFIKNKINLKRNLLGVSMGAMAIFFLIISSVNLFTRIETIINGELQAADLVGVRHGFGRGRAIRTAYFMAKTGQTIKEESLFHWSCSKDCPVLIWKDQGISAHITYFLWDLSWNLCGIVFALLIFYTFFSALKGVTKLVRFLHHVLYSALVGAYLLIIVFLSTALSSYFEIFLRYS